jgi:hypothetical protein
MSYDECEYFHAVCPLDVLGHLRNLQIPRLSGQKEDEETIIIGFFFGGSGKKQ